MLRYHVKKILSSRDSCVFRSLHEVWLSLHMIYPLLTWKVICFAVLKHKQLITSWFFEFEFLRLYLLHGVRTLYYLTIYTVFAVSVEGTNLRHLADFRIMKPGILFIFSPFSKWKDVNMKVEKFVAFELLLLI